MDKLLSDSALVCANTSADLITLGKTLYRNLAFSARMWKTLFQNTSIQSDGLKTGTSLSTWKSFHSSTTSETFTFWLQDTCDTLN